MKKNVLIGIIAGVVAIAVLVGGWFLFSANSTVPVPTAAPTNSQDAAVNSPDATPTTSASAVPSASANPTGLAEVKDLPQHKFSDVKEVNGFSSDQVQTMLSSAMDYASNDLGNQYFLSGKWVEDGMPIKAVVDSSARFFSKKMVENISKIDTNPQTNPDHLTEQVMPVQFFVFPNGNLDGSPLCASDPSSKSSAPTCPKDGISFSNFNYDPATTTDDEPALKVSFSATAKIPVLIDGKEGYSTVKADYMLLYVENANYEEVTNPSKFVIDDYDVKISMSKAVLS